MLVFISDLHFVDETAGKHNLPASAFGKFLDNIKAEVENINNTFIVTEKSLQSLEGEGIPPETLKKLKCLEYEKFKGEEWQKELLETIEKNIGRDQPAEKYKDLISQHIENSKVKELKIILLGDIFDLIRTEEWFQEDGNDRPWGIILIRCGKGLRLF